MMPSNFNVVYLGKLPLLDSSRGNLTAEGAGQFAGRTFGSATDPLWQDFRHLAQRTGYANFTGNTPNDVYNNDGDPVQRAGAVYEYFQTYNSATNTWTPHAYDALATYNNSTITYTDGTTASVQVHIFQDYNGETFWAPQVTQNASQNAMEAKPIRSLTLGTVNTPHANLIAYRDIWEYAVPCFTRGVMITTQDGAKPVEDLAVGDLILTRDNGLQSIRWIGSCKLSVERLEASSDLRPVRIRAGALGQNTPTSDLLVSPQHRVLIRSKIAQRMFGTDEVLVAAKHLLDLPGIEIADDLAEVEYFHILFDRHEILLSNGAETESFYAGPEALNAVGSEASEEIFAIFPELRHGNPAAIFPPARPLVKGRTGRQLAYRHTQNSMALVG